MMYSPRDMQAEMMVRGYAGGGYTQDSPTQEDVVNMIRRGGTRMDNSADEMMMRSFTLSSMLFSFW